MSVYNLRLGHKYVFIFYFLKTGLLFFADGSCKSVFIHAGKTYYYKAIVSIPIPASAPIYNVYIILFIRHLRIISYYNIICRCCDRLSCIMLINAYLLLYLIALRRSRIIVANGVYNVIIIIII